jgi:hypothetical protein
MKRASAKVASTLLPEIVNPGEPWPPPSSLTRETIRDFVVTNGREHGVEFLIALDGDNQLVESIRGQPSSVGLTEKLQRALQNPTSRLTIHHNHPSGHALSDNDLAHLVWPGVSTIFAHTSASGSIFTSHARLSDDGRRAFDREVAEFGFIISISSLYYALQSPVSFDYKVQKQVWRGLLDCVEANLCRRLALFEALNRSGLFLIGTDFSLPPLFFRDDVQRGIDKLAYKIARSYGCDAPACPVGWHRLGYSAQVGVSPWTIH